MIFNDGGGYTDRNGTNPALNVIDNLIAQNKIPVMICIFITRATSPTLRDADVQFRQSLRRKMESHAKDSMRSTPVRHRQRPLSAFLRDEILADVAAKYNLRKDGYSRAITGLSSGGIAAFNAAWQLPDIARVISWIGSFSSIQWKEDPSKPRRRPGYPRKFSATASQHRVWLQDGSNDLDFATAIGRSTISAWPTRSTPGITIFISASEGTQQLRPRRRGISAEMIWLWRDYDPLKPPNVRNRPSRKIQTHLPRLRHQPRISSVGFSLRLTTRL